MIIIVNCPHGRTNAYRTDIKQKPLVKPVPDGKLQDVIGITIGAPQSISVEDAEQARAAGEAVLVLKSEQH